MRLTSFAPKDRRRLLIFVLRVVRSKYPQHAKSINSIASLICEHKAPRTAMFSFLTQLLGRAELNALVHRVTDLFLQTMIQRRVLCDSQSKGQICHACFSYIASVPCEKCKRLKFCYGCMDYGNCCDCDVEEDNENTMTCVQRL